MATDILNVPASRFTPASDHAWQGFDRRRHLFGARDATTGRQHTFFVEFYLLNPDARMTGPATSSHLMVRAGLWGAGARQACRLFGWDEVSLGPDTHPWVAADDCVASEHDLVGHVWTNDEARRVLPACADDTTEVAFDLSVDRLVSFDIDYDDECEGPWHPRDAFQTFWKGDGVTCAYEGEVYLDGHRFVVDADSGLGYADELWGPHLASPWLWLASSDLTSNMSGRRLANSALVIGGAAPQGGDCVLDRQLIGELLLEGETFEFDFSRLWSGTQTHFACTEEDGEAILYVKQQTLTYRLVTRVSCPTDEMLEVRLGSPDATRRHARLVGGGTGIGRSRLYVRDAHRWLLTEDLTLGHVRCEYDRDDACRSRR